MLYGEHVFEALEHFEASEGIYPVPQKAPHMSAGVNTVRSQPQHRPQSYWVTPWNIIDGQSIPLYRDVIPRGKCCGFPRRAVPACRGAGRPQSHERKSVVRGDPVEYYRRSKYPNSTVTLFHGVNHLGLFQMVRKY